MVDNIINFAGFGNHTRQTGVYILDVIILMKHVKVMELKYCTEH